MQNRRNVLYLLIIISLLAALFTGRAVFFNLAYLMGGMLLVSAVWAWLSVRWVRIMRRTRSRRAQVGRSFFESFVVSNRSYIPKLWLEVRDHSELPGHRASHVVPLMRGRQSYQWNIETPCLARGEFRLGPLTLVSGDPFGLFTTPRRIPGTERIIVYPATVPVNKFELPIGVLSGGEAQRRFTHHITTNASSVRDYVAGDSINRVHWRSTARRGRLMVKEFELDPLVDIWLFVDFSSRSIYEDPGVRRVGKRGTIIPGSQDIPPSTEEYGVIVAASLAQHFIEKERALGFTAYTPHREVHEPERGSRQLTRILRTLAVARSLSEYTLGQMLALETQNFTRGTTLIIITSSLGSRWVVEAQILTQRGIRPMCVFIDPHSFGSPQPSDELRARLQLAKIPSITISKNDDLTAALAQRPV